MKKLLFILLLLPSGLTARLQGKDRADSLLAELNSEKFRQRSDTNKVKILYDVCTDYQSIGTSERIKYGLQGLKLAKELNWKKGILKDQGNYARALEYYFESLKASEELVDKKYILMVNMNIGDLYMIMKNCLIKLNFIKL